MSTRAARKAVLPSIIGYGAGTAEETELDNGLECEVVVVGPVGVPTELDAKVDCEASAGSTSPSLLRSYLDCPTLLRIILLFLTFADFRGFYVVVGDPAFYGYDHGYGYGLHSMVMHSTVCIIRLQQANPFCVCNSPSAVTSVFA